MTPEIENKLKEFDEKSKLAKYMTLCAADRDIEKQKFEQYILNKIGWKEKCSIVCVMDGTAIFETSKSFYAKAPFGGAYLHNGEWRSTFSMWQTPELAMLGIIGEKYGQNYFAYYAARMLGIGD